MSTEQQKFDTRKLLADSESAVSTDYGELAARAEVGQGRSMLDLSPSHARYEEIVAEIMRRDAPLEQVLQWDREKQPPLPVLKSMVGAGVFVSGVPVPDYAAAAPVADALSQAGQVSPDALSALESSAFGKDSERQFLRDIGRDGHARAMGTAAQTIARLASVGIGTFMGVSTGLSAQTIFRVGTPAQQAFWLNALHTGTFTYGFALTEETVGSDPRSLTTSFVKETDASGQTVYRINGNKKFIGNAAQVLDADGRVIHRGADFLLVFAVDDPNKPPKDRIFHCFMVPRERIGEENIRHSGGQYNKTGLREVNNGNFDLRDVVVPECCVLGIPGENMYPKLMGTLDVTRFLVGAMGVGTAEAAWQIARDYAHRREQNGQPIADYPMVSFPLEELASRVLVGKLLVAESAKLVDQADREQAQLDASLNAGLATLDDMQRGLDDIFIRCGTNESQSACYAALETCRQALQFGGERIKLKERQAKFAGGIAALQSETRRLRDTTSNELVEPVKTVFRTSGDLLSRIEKLREPIRFGTETAMAKLYGSELAQQAIYQAIQTLGGNGFMESPEEGHGLGKRARDAAVLSIYEGQSNIQRSVIAQGILLQQLKKVSLPLQAPGSLRQKLRYLLLNSSVTKDAHYAILMSTSRTPVERANAAFKYAVVDVMGKFNDALKEVKQVWEKEGVPKRFRDWDEGSKERQQNLLAANRVQARLGLLADIAVERKLIHLASRELAATQEHGASPDSNLLRHRQLLEDFQVLGLERVLELVRRMFGDYLSLQESRYAHKSPS